MKHQKIGLCIVIVGLFLTYACAHTGAAPGAKSVQLTVPRAYTTTASPEVSYILQEVDGVIDWRTDIFSTTVYLTFDPKKVSMEEILQALEMGGFPTFGSPRYLN